MGRIRPSLEIALLDWRHARAAAVAAADPQRVADLDGQMVFVFVEYTGDTTAMKEAGLQVQSVMRTIATGRAKLSNIEAIAEAQGVETIELSGELKPELNKSVPITRANQLWTAPTPFKGHGVVVGIIDTGIDVFHDSFRSVDGKTSRILHIWDQQLEETPARPPDGFTYGTEFDQDNISVFLRAQVENIPITVTFAHTDGGKGEEEGHGTHVAGIAAGDGSGDDKCSPGGTYIGVVPEADIIAVRRRGMSGVVDAVNYIISKATQIGKPCVINMSFGNTLGPADGSDAMDVSLDQIMTSIFDDPEPGVVIVKSAGNMADEKQHARRTIPPNGNSSFTFILAKSNWRRSNVSDDIIHIFYSAAAALDVTLTRVASGHSISHAHGAAATNHVLDGITIRISSENTGSPMSRAEVLRHKLIVIKMRTAAKDEASRGNWRITLTETAGNAAVADLWSDRQDGDIVPKFVDADVAIENTISQPGNCASVITVGNFGVEMFGSVSTYKLNESSSRGLPASEAPSLDDVRPHIAAPGTNIKSANSGTSATRCCECCCDGKYVEMSGTSMAAPHVTGIVAQMLQKNPRLTFVDVRKILQATARIDDIPPGEVPPVRSDGFGFGTPGAADFKPIRINNLWGAGIVNADAAVNLVPLPAAQPAPAPAPQPAPPGPMPFAATPETTFTGTLFDRLRLWQGLAQQNPVWQVFAALMSTHADEVRDLINTNKRVATVWHRNGGPKVLRALLTIAPDADAQLPKQLAGFNVSTLLNSLMSITKRYSGAMLTRDIERWGGFVSELPGVRLSELEERFASGASA